MEVLTRSRALGARLWRAHSREVGAFGVVGGVAFVVDVGLFNLLRFGGDGLLADQPLTAKVVSASVATVFAWAGNRWWTFRHRNRSAALRELGLFVAMNAAALLIGLAVLATSHYVLGLRGPLADNTANLVGIALGTAFRYVAYRLWVFRRPREAGAAPGSAPGPAPGPTPGPAPGPAPGPDPVRA
ncbi:GtrA family protein [Quadrisphaera sp. KR29]|uniref:GtrA family protein n=1 Tax=Quadrisphaera sp. KR29 TaxID=3461391 RepID=UPI0040449DD7